MPNHAAGGRGFHAKGFSLIELLVVIAIIGILAGMLVLAAGDSGARRLEASAEEFQGLLRHACEVAELGGRDIGLTVGSEGYRFSRLAGEGWVAIGPEATLRPRPWPAGLQVELRRDGELLELDDGDSARPQAACLGSGELTPFTLDLRLRDLPRAWHIEALPDGRVRMEEKG